MQRTRAFVILCTLTCATAPGRGQPAALFEDDFSGEQLDATKWVRTVLNDFETEIVEIADGTWSLPWPLAAASPTLAGLPRPSRGYNVYIEVVAKLS